MWKRLKQFLINNVGPFLLAAIRDQIHDELLQKSELEEGHVKLRPDQTATIFSTEEPGILSGFVNCVNIGGVTALRIEIYLNSVEPGSDGVIKPYLYTSAEIVQTKEKWAPIIALDPIYAPMGGMVSLVLTNGVQTSFYYYIYRE